MVLAGCGGTSHQEYEKKANAVAERYEQEYRTFARDYDEAPTVQETEPVYRRLQKALRDGADQLEGMSPPDDVRRAHEQTIEGARALAREIQTGIDFAAANDADGHNKWRERFDASDFPATRKLATARKIFRRNGYYRLGQE